ncbi:mitochondrial acidic protein MAM33 isoform X2 [Olea europaea var. sylvestris]|uniref:mitochondrial acidic protein MAM33 isoform X2 n=1 Tax=Olea europaea var. sylvestris TaxID=158386 RepID=UPI000C1CD755|nr:mitochondrial acidic protein MAM33 isoform X2 [Olea europaea var. sylvestris]
MPRVTPILRRAHKAIEELDLLKVLQSEINHELSSHRFQTGESGSPEDFVLEWDSPKSQDVVLRKKCASGEEVAISALLGGDTFQGDGSFPREALVKICVKKPGLNSLLQFDCVASRKGGNESEFDIQNANYMHSPSSLDSSFYKGPPFSSLDPDLQHELKQYLATRGIGEDFINFLLLYLHRKEQGQYVNWLQKLKDIIGENSERHLHGAGF